MSDPVTRFADLALAAPVLRAIEEIGYEAPSPIQAASIPPLLEGRDLLGQAQTGTGKTAAFALPLLSRIDLSNPQPQLLVLTPTRELAIQVAEAMQGYARHLEGFHILPVYGGQGMGTQLRQLKRGAHVIVGTPGRIMDHLRRETLSLAALTTIVLDEADEMLRMGFIDDVEWILGHTPETRQIALFSATMPAPIERIARRYLRDPAVVRIAAKTTTVATINQRYWPVTGLHKLDALTRILEVEEFDAMLVFVRTKTETVELAEKLEARGYACSALNGDMNQQHREQTVDKLKRGQLDIVVATDVAARGLDVERISHVVNYDIPYDTEAYVHRIGRTGRAGRKGEAILFVAPRERHLLRAIEKATRQPIAPMTLPTCQVVADRRVARFKQRIADTIAGHELDFFEAMVNEYRSEHDVEPERIAAALVYLLQKDRPLVQEGCAEPAQEPERRERPPFKERERAAYEGRPAPAAREGRPSAYEGRPAAAPEGRPAPAERDARPRRSRPPEAGMARYRIEVGRQHGAQPKNIVGAIANEANIESRFIGQITLNDEFSTVDLPADLPPAAIKHLQKVWVCGQQLNLAPLDEARPSGPSARPTAPSPRPTTRPRPGRDDRSQRPGTKLRMPGGDKPVKRKPAK